MLKSTSLFYEKAFNICARREHSVTEGCWRGFSNCFDAATETLTTHLLVRSRTIPHSHSLRVVCPYLGATRDGHSSEGAITAHTFVAVGCQQCSRSVCVPCHHIHCSRASSTRVHTFRVLSHLYLVHPTPVVGNTNQRVDSYH